MHRNYGWTECLVFRSSLFIESAKEALSDYNTITAEITPEQMSETAPGIGLVLFFFFS